MLQEVFMPNGHRIFSTEDKNLMYDEKTMQSMIKNGYVVKIDGKKKRGKK